MHLYNMKMRITSALRYIMAQKLLYTQRRQELYVL